ncbi:MarR family transcriptional regulator (plasmid) [Rhodococcus sp. USK10]|uniref:MarR family winged helix-turn-helix transcriptional regulator n=1 Tax=Rhodococcus sp. USK10 TaxID=2789739 RepID=UPI001C5F247F|nr:MarR family transcriptional regulator [Rhodococcus sp. USK10]QYB00239.1 MarR family transcriptional regulator [Rhodococcus sp. USK10]
MIALSLTSEGNEHGVGSSGGHGPSAPPDLKDLARQWSSELRRADVHPFLITAMVQRISLHIERQFVDIARSHGLGAGDLRVLLALARSGPEYALRPTELFRQLLITSGAVSKQVERLVALNLVRRATHPSDIRIQLVVLEDAGHQIARHAMETIISSFCGLQSLDTQQSNEIAAALKLLLTTVESASDLTEGGKRE